MDKAAFYEFGTFRLDLNQKCLWRGPDLVGLTLKEMETLIVLIENRGNLVAKDVLLDEVWPETFVEEATLTQNISTLRKKLAQPDETSQFIETIPRRGYRFVGNVREIFGNEDVLIVQTHTRTRIVAAQEIHLSNSDNGKRKSAIASAPKILISVLTVILIAIAIVAGYRNIGWSKPAFEQNFRNFQITKLTSNGNIYRVAVSRDGKYAALAEKRGEKQALFVRQVGNAQTVQIIPPGDNDFIGVTFSPDNESILYSAYPVEPSGQPGKTGKLYNIPMLGGTPVEILSDIDSPPAISADGQKYAFVRQNPAAKESYLIEYDERTKTETRIAARPISERFTRAGIAYSPNGKLIASSVFSTKDPRRPLEIAVTNVETGEQRSLTTDSWLWIGQISWIDDGSGLIFPAFGTNSPNMTDEIWMASFPDGKTRQITNGANGFAGLGASKDSKTLLTVMSNRASALWVSPATDTGHPSLINKSVGDNSLIPLGISWTTNGKIIYAGAQTGNAELWLVEPDGTNQKQLTNNAAADFSPVCSADGRFVVFVSNRSGTANIWRINVDGTDPKQVSSFSQASSPSVSPDSRSIYFTGVQNPGGDPFLWKTGIDGGDAFRLTDTGLRFPVISPDGKYIAGEIVDNKIQVGQAAKTRLGLFSIDGTTIKQFDAANGRMVRGIAWTPDGKGISYISVEDDVSNIWVQPIDGGTPQKRTDFNTDQIFRYSWSPDNKQIVLEKGMAIYDIMMIKDGQVN